jgi:hemerythrin
VNSELQWKGEYSLGHDVIDSEHKKLFEIANQIFAVKKPFTASDKIKNMIHELYNYMKYHFDHEEELMAEISFEKIDDHKQKHGEIITEMNKILRESKDFNILELKLTYMMQKWVLVHILEQDLMLKKAIDHANADKFTSAIESASRL